MGIVNVTPDSFSDGGQHDDTDSAVAHARRLIEEGARILDLGGESTRPGAEPVSVADELARLLPVIEALQQGRDATEVLGLLAEVSLGLDTTALRGRLAQLMFIADTWGRLSAAADLED